MQQIAGFLGLVLLFYGGFLGAITVAGGLAEGNLKAGTLNNAIVCFSMGVGFRLVAEISSRLRRMERRLELLEVADTPPIYARKEELNMSPGENGNNRVPAEDPQRARKALPDEPIPNDAKEKTP
jgi:hypothetical protein